MTLQFKWVDVDLEEPPVAAILAAMGPAAEAVAMAGCGCGCMGGEDVGTCSATDTDTENDDDDDDDDEAQAAAPANHGVCQTVGAVAGGLTAMATGSPGLGIATGGVVGGICNGISAAVANSGASPDPNGYNSMGDYSGAPGEPGR